MVPKVMILAEFNLSSGQLRLIENSGIFRRTLENLQSAKENIARDLSIPRQEEIDREARRSLETVISIRDVNSPESGVLDPKSHRISAEQAWKLLELAGFTKVEKRLNVNAGTTLDAKEVGNLIAIMREARLPSTIVDITPEAVRGGALDDRINPRLAGAVETVEGGQPREPDEQRTKGPTGDDATAIVQERGGH